MQLKSIGRISEAGNLVDNLLGDFSDIDKVSDAIENLTLTESAELLVKKRVGDEEAKLALVRKVGSEASAKQALESAKVTAAETAETGATVGLSNALKGLWVSIAPILANPLTWIAVGLGALIKVGHETSQAIDEIREKAQALGSEFNETKSNIDDYKEQIESLYETINNNNSSVQQVTEARQTLMTVQDELIDKFGSEKETIDIVTDAINGQSDALDKLASKKWQETINEFNKNDFWGNFANWREGYSDNMDRMIHEMENAGQIGLRFTNTDYYGGKYDNVVKELEKRGFTYDVGTASFFKDDGTLRNLYDEILDIQEALKDEAPDYFNKILEEDATEAKEKLDQYGDMWDTYILNDRILANEKLANSFKDINDAYSEYEKAKTSGDKDATDAAVGNFSKKLNEAVANAGDEKGTVEYFKNMYPTLAREAEKWEFKTNIIPEFDTSKLKGKTQNDILEMLQTAGNQEGEDIFSSILENATNAEIVTGEYSQRVETLLGLLTEWGILQADIAESANETSNSLSINELSNQITTFKTAQESLTTALSEQSSTGTISNDTLAALKENYEGIENAIEFTTDGIILNTSKLRDLNAEQRKNTADELAKKEEDLTKQYQEATLKLAEYDRLSKEHSDENDNLKSVYDDLVNSQQNEVNALDDEIAGLKALQKEYNNSISTHNAFMEALSSPNEGAGYESIVSSLEKVQEQWDKGLYGTDDIRTFVDYMTSADMSNASVDEIMNQYEKAMETAKQFFTENKDGSRKFLELLQETSIEVDGVTQSLATYDEASNKWNIDIQDMAKASEATGYSTDFLIDNLNRLKDFGFNVVFGETDDFTNYKQAIDDVNKEIEDTQSLLDAFGGKSEGLKNKLQELNETKVNLEKNIPTSAVDEAIRKIQTLQKEIQTLQSIPGITSADIDKKRQQQADIAQTAGIELTAVIGGDTEKAEVAAENLKKAIEDSTATMLVDANVKPAQDAINSVANAAYTANLKLRLSTVNATDVNNVINKIKENASSGGATAYGTANIGKSFSGGSIGTNKTLHNVMVSEVQPEMVVDPSSGQYTIYKYPTMLNTLPKNSIVFNGKQTSEILKNGMTTSYGKALASGTLTGVSFAKTTAETSGSGNLLNDNSSTSKSNTGNDKTKGKSNNNNDKKNNKNKSNKSEIDWIARKLERLQSVIDLTRAKFENLFNMNDRQNNLAKQIKTTTTLMETNEKAVDKYEKKAEKYAKKTKFKSGKNKGKRVLSDGLIKKIQNGKINGTPDELIKEYGETTYNAIEKYKQYWDAGQQARQAAEEAETKIRELREEQYQLYIDEAEANLDKINALSEINRGYARSKDYLQEQIKWIDQKYNYEIEIAKLNKDSVKENQLISEKEKEIAEAKKTQLQLYVDDSEAEISKLDALIDISTSYKQSNKYLDEQKKHIQDKYKYEIEIAKLEKDITKEYTLQKQLQKELLKIEKSKFDNIQQYYDTQLDFVQEMYSLTDKQIELIETKGAVVNSGYYKDQQKIENEKLQTYNEELKSLKDQAAVLEQTEGGKYSEEWIACQKAILSVNSAIADTTINLSELNNKINENTKAMIDRVLSIGDRAIKENNFIGDLTSDIEDFNAATHQMTTEGLTRLQSYSKNMNIAASEASYLGDIVKKLESAYDKGKMTVDLGDAGVFNFESFNQMREYIDEFYDSWQDKIKETNEYQSKVIDFMRNKLKEELAALNDVIEAKKQSLSESKSLREYEKNIREQTTNIGLIQKQMTGVSGDTSEEGIARYLSLQKQLSDAEQQLEETEFDHMISEMQASLDKLSEEYSATIDALSSNTGYLLEEGNQILTNNGVLISEFTDRLCGDNGYIVEFKQFVNEFKTATDALTSGDVSILNALIGNENSIISAINADKDAVTKLPNYTTSLSEIKSILEGIKEHVNPTNSGNNDNNNPTTTPDNSQSPSMSAGAETNVAPIIHGAPKLDNSTQLSSTFGAGVSATLTSAAPNLLQSAESKQAKAVVDLLNASETGYSAKKGKTYGVFNEWYKNTKYGKGTVLRESELNVLRSALGTTDSNVIIEKLKDFSKRGLLGDIKFSSGGIGKLIPAGEDGLAFVRNGEGFVRPEDVPHIQELLNIVPQVNDVLKPMTMPNLKPLNNQSIGDIQFNIEMNGVNDVETFSKQIREAYCSDDRIRKMIQSDNIMQLKSNSKSYNRNMYR